MDEVLGKILFEARERKGVDLAQVEIDTNIEKRYIDALEKCEYHKLPGETYIVGFLRNYSTYLGLDSDEIVRQYKNTKIEATEVPQEILLPKKNGNAVKIISVLALAVFIIGVVYLSLILFFSYRSSHGENKRIEGAEENQITKREVQEYEITQDVQFEKEVFKGDKIKANIEGDDYFITVLETYPSLRLKVANLDDIVVETSETRTFDLNDDSIDDIELTVNSIAESRSDGLSISIASGSDIGTASNSDGQEIIEEPFETEQKQKKNVAYKTFFTGTQAYPVSLNAEFSGYCLFRIDIDKQNRIEQFYQKGSRLDNIKAQNAFRVWASNGFALKCTRIGGGVVKDLGVMGKPGEVVVKDFKWLKNDKTGEFYFVEIDVD